MKLKTTFVILGIALLAAGCDQRSQTYDFYTVHPEKIQAKIDQCRTLTFEQRSEDKGCIAAIQASRTVGGLLQSMEANPQVFGAKIMSFQVDLVNTKERIAKMKSSKQAATNQEQLKQLEKHAKDVQYKINVYRGVVRLVGG